MSRKLPLHMIKHHGLRTRLLPHSDGSLLAEKESDQRLVTRSANGLLMLIKDYHSLKCWKHMRLCINDWIKMGLTKHLEHPDAPQHVFFLDGKIKLSWYIIGFLTLDTAPARSCKCESPTDTKRVMRFAWQLRRSVLERTHWWCMAMRLVWDIDAWSTRQSKLYQNLPKLSI